MLPDVLDGGFQLLADYSAKPALNIEVHIHNASHKRLKLLGSGYQAGLSLQQQFLEDAALQCGICTPGFIVATKALLDKNPDPTETEIRFWLAGNLCRCTGYDKIVRAVQDAAAEMRGG